MGVPDPTRHHFLPTGSRFFKPAQSAARYADKKNGKYTALLKNHALKRIPTPPLVGRQGNLLFRALVGRRLADSANHVPVLSSAFLWLFCGAEDLNLFITRVFCLFACLFTDSRSRRSVALLRVEPTLP